MALAAHLDDLVAVPKSSSDVTRSIVPGEIIVALQGDTDIAEVRAQLSNRLELARLDLGGGLEVTHLLTVGTDPKQTQTLVQLRLGEFQDVAAAGEVLRGLPDIAWVEPNYAYRGAIQDLTPNDPSYGSQYHHPLMQNNLAWDTTLGNGVVVAVTDDGMQLDHPDLVANLYVNAAEIAGNGVDDDANGKIDDRNGWDFVSNDNNPSPVDPGDSHGTHVAGIVAGRTNNAVGIAGTAGGAKVMPLRFAGSDGGFTSTIILNTFRYAADNGAKIVSTSYNIDSFVGNSTFVSALQYLYDRNVLHLNSAGNNGQLNPARQAFHQTLLVASTTATDARSSFSNYGTGVDIAAPGSGILSTVVGSGYESYDGTSMATPNAAGVAALIWSANPLFTRDQVAARLVGTATNINAQNPAYAGLLGGGRANSNNALNATLAPPKISRLLEIPTTPNPQIFPISRLTVALDKVFDKASIETAANWSLINAGTDGLFGTGDDQPVTLTRSAPYMIGANEVVFTFPSLTSGNYRFTGVAGGLRDPFLVALDGDANGTAGGNFVKDFQVAAGTTVFSADFSDVGGNPSTEGFVASGPASAWHLSTGRGTNAGHSTDDSYYFGAGETSSGGGAYSDSADGSLTSPLINLSSFSGTILLEFNHFLASETGYDFASVSVIDGAVTTEIARSGGLLPHSTTGFAATSFDLSAYAGRSIQIRFRFTSDSSITFEGWYVDDVTIRAASTSSTTGTVSGQVWHDLDGDGTLDAGEPGLPGWTAYVDQNANATLDINVSSTQASTDVPRVVPDNNMVTSQTTVTGVAGLITDLNVSLNIAHTNDADLDVFLITPGGARIELFTDVGGTGDGFLTTVLDDEAVSSMATASAPFTGDFRPEGLLSAVDGLNPNGSWTLEVSDDTATETGTLTAWSLQFTTSEVSVVTNASGNYLISGLAPGTHTVRQVPQAGYIATFPPSGSHTATVAAGQVAAGLNFGNAPLPTQLRGTVWNDANGNMIRDAGENGQAGWTVYLDTNGSGTFDAQTGNRPSTDVPKSILDYTTVTSQTIVSGLPGSITDLNVSINLAHTYDSDLNIYLISPTGTRIELATGVGGSGDNFMNTVFDQQAATAITAGTAPFTGSYRPEGSLSVLNGTSANGTWRLEITDTAGQDEGSLTAWSLLFTTAEPSATSSANGDYILTGLTAGNYVVREVVQPMWTRIAPASGSYNVTLASGQTIANLDFGNAQGNTPPTIANIPDQTIAEDGSLLSNFTIGDAQTATTALVLSAATSNPTLLPLGNIVFGGSAGNRSVTLTPAANEFGAATVTVTVTDAGGLTTQDTILLTVNPVNDVPSFTKGTDQTVAMNAGPQAVTGWATAISAGPTNESSQTINFNIVTNSNSALFSTPPAVAANGTLTYTPALGASGSATITLAVQDNGGTTNGGVDTSATQTFTITVNAPATFQVSSFTPTTTGAVINVNRDLDPSTLNLYDVEAGTLGPADVTLVGSVTGNVRGSLVVASSLRSVTFIRTSGTLAPDTYTLTLRSAADGFRDSTAALLDGDANGTAGGNFTQTFVVSAPPPGAVTVSLPNFVRGPQQTVSVPANGASGIPLTVSEGTNLTSATVQIAYNPALLTITGVTLAAGLPAGATVNIDTPLPGSALVTFTSPTPLPGGTVELARLQATVPATATYRSKHVLDLVSSVLNAGSIPAITDDAVHVAAYFGDATGNGTYSAQDASRVARLAVGLDTGLQLYKLLDPAIVADISGNGLISATDTSRVLQAGVGISTVEIPSLPDPAVSLTQGGPDPKLSIPRNMVATPGERLSIPVMIDSIVDLTGNGLESADLVIYFDAATLDVTSVTLGSLLSSAPGNWFVAANIDPLAGRIIISLAGQVPLEGFFEGELVHLNAQVKAHATGSIALNLAASSRGPSRYTQLNEGYLTLIPAPTDAANDPVDGLLTILSATTETPAQIARTARDIALLQLVADYAARTLTDARADAFLAASRIRRR